MSAKSYVTFNCELDASIEVIAKVDWEDDIWIGMSNSDGNRALLRTADARSLGQFLINAANKQETENHG